MKRKSFVFLVIFIVIILLCFLAIRYIMEANEIRNLQVTVEGVQIQELKVTYNKLKLIIEISNPTKQDISQLYIDYNIFIADSFAGNGSIPLTNIPAQTTKETSTTILIYFVDVANAVIDAIINHKFILTIQGTLYARILSNLFSISQNFSSTYSYS